MTGEDDNFVVSVEVIAVGAGVISGTGISGIFSNCDELIFWDIVSVLFVLEAPTVGMRKEEQIIKNSTNFTIPGDDCMILY